MFAQARLANLTMPELEQSRAAVLKRSPPPNRAGATSTPSNGSSNGMSGFSPLREAQHKLGRQILDENLPYHSLLGLASRTALNEILGSACSCRYKKARKTLRINSIGSRHFS